MDKGLIQLRFANQEKEFCGKAVTASALKLS